MNLDRDHLRFSNYINLVKVFFFSLINIAYAHTTQTHSIQSTQSENSIIYVNFFGEIIIFGLSIILYVILRFQLEYSQSLLSPNSDIRTN